MILQAIRSAAAHRSDRCLLKYNRGVCVGLDIFKTSSKNSLCQVISLYSPTSRSFTSIGSIHGTSNPQYVNASEAPDDYVSYSALVYPDFITEQESAALENVILKRMRRKRFEAGHWDSVITGYKEVEIDIHNVYQKNPVSPLSVEAIERVRDHIEQTHFSKNGERSSNNEVEWINCHAIHLKKDGELTAHVDSIKFSGDIVAGLSLLSPSIMRLRPAAPSELSTDDGYCADEDTVQGENKEVVLGDGNEESNSIATGKALTNKGHVDLYLPPASLYVLSGVSRYNYTHELLPSGSQFVFPTAGGADPRRAVNEEKSLVQVERDDRISVIFRDAK